MVTAFNFVMPDLFGIYIYIYIYICIYIYIYKCSYLNSYICKYKMYVKMENVRYRRINKFVSNSPKWRWRELTVTVYIGDVYARLCRCTLSFVLTSMRRDCAKDCFVFDQHAEAWGSALRQQRGGMNRLWNH